MSQPQLSQIWLFPIKSLDGIAVPQATIASGGSLQGDRQFALHDAQWHYINAKKYPTIHQIRAQYTLGADLIAASVTLSTLTDGTPQTFDLQADRKALAAWFSDYFAQPVTIGENISNGFPDDPEAYGPTVISEATLQTVAQWYGDLDVSQIRRRLRTNLEISHTVAFAEDALYGLAGTTKTFTIGRVTFTGTNPCQRCPVPTRDPDTGEVYHRFQQKLIEQRRASLPPWAEPSRFNHFYRLALNTRINPTEAGKILAIGDPITGLPDI
jgi:uncharacterized protein YcbX